MGDFPPTTYTGVHIYRSNHVYLSGVSDELAEANVDHSVVLRHLDGAWAQKPTAEALCGMCASERAGAHTLLNLGTDGTVVEFLFPGDRSEEIDPSDEGPSDLVNMRALRRIGGYVFAAGMARHVYRRDAENQWTRIDNGVFVPRAQRTQPVGFNALCGFAHDDIYAAGMLGEIWSYNGSSWSQEPSPTNVALNAMTQLGSDQVCIVGLVGVVICGKRGHWRAIQHSATERDLWGATTFRERVYVSGDDGVFLLDPSAGSLEKIDLGLGDDFTTAYLDANDGVMWSVGPKHLARTYDGVKWEQVEGKKS